MKVFLDDVREAPAGWVRCKSAKELRDLLLSPVAPEIDEMSLDHDLGDACTVCILRDEDGYFKGSRCGHNGYGFALCLCDCHETGYDLVKKLEEWEVWPGQWENQPLINIHSANPVGADNMLDVLRRSFVRLGGRATRLSAPPLPPRRMAQQGP